MARVVICHGIGYMFKHRKDMHESWYEAIRTGMHDSHTPPIKPDDVAAVYYGNCFRTLNTKGDVIDDELAAIPNYGSADLSEALELELLQAFAAGVEETDGGKALVQGLLRRLERSRFLGDVPGKVIISMIKQVHRYLTEDQLRKDIQDRIAATVTDETRVLIGHSLGSIAVFDALRSGLCGQVDTLITLGSPLGVNAVRSQLTPPVAGDGTVEWQATRRWINVAADEDPIALIKKLKPILWTGIEDQPVFNGRFAAHSVKRYLTTSEVARGIVDGLGE